MATVTGTFVTAYQWSNGSVDEYNRTFYGAVCSWRHSYNHDEPYEKGLFYFTLSESTYSSASITFEYTKNRYAGYLYIDLYAENPYENPSAEPIAQKTLNIGTGYDVLPGNYDELPVTTVTFSGLHVTTSEFFIEFSAKLKNKSTDSYWTADTTIYSRGNHQNPVLSAYEYVDPTPPTPTVDPPTVGTPTLSNVKGSSVDSSLSSLYIAWKSKVKVEAAITSTAALSSVYFTYPQYGFSVSMSYNSSTGKYEGTTPQAISENTTFTVYAVNSGGTGSSQASLYNVYAYTAPYVTVNETYTYRCDSSGAKTEGGSYYKIRVTANITSLGGNNSVTLLTVGVKNSGTRYSISSGVTSGPYSGLSDPNAVYVLTIIIDDKVSGQVTQEYALGGMFRDVIFKRSSSSTKSVHVGVGMTPSDSTGYYGYTTIQLPPDAKIVIGGQDITAWLRQQIGGSW